MNKHTRLKIEKEKNKEVDIRRMSVFKSKCQCICNLWRWTRYQAEQRMRPAKGRNKAADLRRDSQGRCGVAVDAAVLGWCMQADRKHDWAHTPAICTAPLGRMPFLFFITTLFIFYFNFLPVRYESPRCFGTNLSAFDLLSEARFSSSRGTCSLPAIYYLE